MAHVDAHHLRHPLYLDVPMMINFLAAIEDGVSYDVNVSRSRDRKGKTAGEAEGKVGLPSLLGLLPFDLRGRLSGEFEGQNSEELQLVKQHTEASLFNKLRNALLDAGAIRQLGPTLDPSSVETGEIVEVAGHVVRNPLAEILALFDRMFPMFENQPGSAVTSTGRRNKQAPPGQSDAAQKTMGIQYMHWISDDLKSANTQDALLKVGTEHTLVLTLRRDFGTGAALDDLLGANVSVLAKVSDCVPAGTEINLLRRSVLGYVTNVDEMFRDLAATQELNLELTEGRIGGPTLQLVPLAMFV
jgi:hypothetical protein